MHRLNGPNISTKGPKQDICILCKYKIVIARAPDRTGFPDKPSQLANGLPR